MLIIVDYMQFINYPISNLRNRNKNNKEKKSTESINMIDGRINEIKAKLIIQSQIYKIETKKKKTM